VDLGVHRSHRRHGCRRLAEAQLGVGRGGTGRGPAGHRYEPGQKRNADPASPTYHAKQSTAVAAPVTPPPWAGGHDPDSTAVSASRPLPIEQWVDDVREVLSLSGVDVRA